MRLDRTGLTLPSIGLSTKQVLTVLYDRHHYRPQFKDGETETQGAWTVHLLEEQSEI